jgi:hypothetical protein
MACRPPVAYANPRDVGELAEPLRSRIHTLILDAPRHGLILISGRRTPYQQWLLRHARCPGQECDPSCQGVPTTALPGRSKHQTGEAADMGGIDLDWARSQDNFYGVSSDVVPREPWHFEARGTPTVRIIRWGTPPVPSDPNAGRPWVTIEPGDTDAEIYAKGGRDNEVAETQWRLTDLSARLDKPEMNPGPIDGVYGPRSQEAIEQYKQWVIRWQKSLGVPHWQEPVNANVGEKAISVLRFWTGG